MARVRRYVEYLDGQTCGVVVTAGDEERARRNGLDRGTPEFNLEVVWYAAKRNGLPYADGNDEEGMLAWLDHVTSWDMYMTQEDVDAVDDPEVREQLQKLVRDDLGEA